MKKLFSIFLSVVMILALLASCGGTEDAATSSDTSDSAEGAYDTGATVVYAIAAGWETLVPFHWSTSGQTGTLVWDKLYDKLVTVRADGSYTERAAQSWEQNEDGTVLTFHLNPACKWHDGVAVTASDWVWTAKLLANADFVTTDGPKLCALFAGTDENGVMQDDANFGVKALDDTTLEITFKNPISLDAFFSTYNMYFNVLPEHCFEGIAAADIQSSSFFDAPIGSGPMVFESQMAGSEINFTTNHDYQLGAPQFAKLVMRVISQSNYASSFMTGEIDMAYPFISRDEAIELQSEENVSVIRSELPANIVFFFVNHDMISDVRVRKAMNLLIDKEQIVETVYGGDAIATESCVLPGLDVYESLPSGRDVETAKALLDEADWDYNEKVKVATPASREKVALIVQQNWADAGLIMDLETVDAGTMFGGLYSGTYSMGAGGGYATSDPFYQNTNFDYRANTIYRIKDTKYIDLMNAAYAATSEEEYKAVCKEYQEYMADNMTMIPILFYYSYGVTSARLEGCTPADAYDSNDVVWEWKVAR